MSIRLLSDIWSKDVTGNERAVLQVLCDYANDDGICWPSLASVAWKVGCSTQTVRNMFRGLYQIGALEKIEEGGGRHKTNKYRVNLNALPSKAPMESPYTEGDHPWERPRNWAKGHDGPDFQDLAKPTTNPQNIEENPQKQTMTLFALPSNPDELNPQNSEQTPKELFDPNRQLEPSVIEPSVITDLADIRTKPPARKPTKQANPYHDEAIRIISVYCTLAEIEQVASYPKAIGQAMMLAKAGMTAAELPALYRFVSNWARAVDLGLLVSQLDKYRSHVAITNKLTTTQSDEELEERRKRRDELARRRTV